MTDVLTKEQRSYNMSMIRAGDTKPEIALRKLLFANGIRGYRIHFKLTGKPDIVFLRKRIAIFVDGCFWHKCPECFKSPEANKAFWKKKIDGNVKRDEIVNNDLKNKGWKVIRIWEHETKKDLNKCFEKIYKELQQDITRGN